MSDGSNGKFSDWISNLEPPFIFSGSVLTFGMLLIVLGILQWFQVPYFGTLIASEKFRWVTIVIGIVCLFSSPIIYALLKNINGDGENNKPLSKLFNTKSKSASLQFGLNHIDKVVFHYYLEKSPVTTVDKKNAMSAILRMISLTTFPSSITNLCRMSISEVREKGRFTILAAHLIDAHRLESLETMFSYKSEKPSGVAGHVVNLKETIRINDVAHPPAKYKGVYVPTPDNEIPIYKSGSILAIPIYENPALPLTSEILAVLSISSSKANYFNDTHEKDLENYCSRISNLLIHFKKTIKIDPMASKKFRIITISGQSGSGKTTLMNELLRYLEPLGWKKIQIGKLFREFCEARGYSIEEIEKIPPAIHRQFDGLQEEILKTDFNVILEGRMSGYLAHKIKSQDVFRVFCDLPLEKRVERFANRETESLKEAEYKVSERDNKDLAVYSALYNLEDYRDRKYYNLYLDTTKAPDELAKIVFDELKNFDND